MTLRAGRIGPGTGTGGVVWAVACALLRRGVRVHVDVDRIDALPDGARVGSGGPALAFDRRPGTVVRASGGVHAAWEGRCADTVWRRLRSRAAGVHERERRVFRAARAVVANAEKVRRELAFWHGIDADLVRTGVDLARFRPAPRPARRGRVALFLGHEWRRKGLDLACDAFLAVAGRHDRLWVAGDDAHSVAWRRRCPDDRLRWLGVVDPARVLPAADAVLAPSRYDAASNVVLEACACGVPVVASVEDGAAEILGDRRLVAADVKGFAAGLRLAWEDRALGAACRADAERWPVARMVDGLVDALVRASGERDGEAG